MANGRFKSKELLLYLLTTNMVLNIMFLIFVRLPLLYLGLKFNILEKINTLLNSLFFDYSNEYEIYQMMKKNINKKQKINQFK